MRVLLIAFHYPPDPAVGALRAGRVAASLAAAGHKVQVLSVRGQADPQRDRDPTDPRIGVRRVRNALDLRGAFLAAKALVARRSGPEPAEGEPAGDRTWTPPADVAAWKRYVFSLLWLPDDRQGWILSALPAAMRAIVRGTDLVYTTAPPFSAHVLGWILKLLTGVRWVAEFRDPWVGNPWKPAFVRSRAADAADAWLERRCLANADRVVAVTAAAARSLAGRQRGPGTVVLVRNGIPASTSANDGARMPPTGERTIVYVGTLYHKRDPRPFLRAIADLRMEGRLPPLTVEFIGDCARYGDHDLAALCSELGIADLVRFVPSIPHAECQERIRRADLLLLLAQEQPSQVPQKLYEYLAARRPIIAFADEDGETAQMLRDVGGHSVITHATPDLVRAGLESALDDRSTPPDHREDILREWSTERQMQRLVTILEEVSA